VTPSGETVLIDTGNGGAAAVRDAGRIMEVIKDAGVTKIDHLITTHWHGDTLAVSLNWPSRSRSPSTSTTAPTCSPHRPRTTSSRTSTRTDREGDAHGRQTGRQAGGQGSRLARGRIRGQVLKTNLSGAGRPNPYCGAVSPAQAADPTENAQSVSSYITFGKFRIVHMGDLTYNKELDLMCPNNRLGGADLFIVSHHGQAISNSPALVHALQPRAAIINNGTRKGGQPDAMRVLFSSPGLEESVGDALLAA
jgi:hypothetical protein